MNFYACVLANGTTLGDCNGENVDCSNINFVTLLSPSDQQNLLICGVTASKSNKTVNFTLRHALSLVEFVWVPGGDAPDGVTYKLEELKVVDYKKTGNISYSGITPSWTLENTSAEIEVYKNTTSVFENSNIPSLMLIPGQDLKCVVKYSIWQNGAKVDEKSTETKTLVQSMAIKNKYSLKLIPSRNSYDFITFTVSVSDWVGHDTENIAI